MIATTPPEMDFCMRAGAAVLAVGILCVPFMNGKWAGRICRVAARLIFLLIVLHNLHKLVS